MTEKIFCVKAMTAVMPFPQVFSNAKIVTALLSIIDCATFMNEIIILDQLNYSLILYTINVE